MQSTFQVRCLKGGEREKEVCSLLMALFIVRFGGENTL
jgi:hypothetical protein